jgi:hypothetical protein
MEIANTSKADSVLKISLLVDSGFTQSSNRSRQPLTAAKIIFTCAAQPYNPGRIGEFPLRKTVANG